MSNEWTDKDMKSLKEELISILMCEFNPECYSGMTIAEIAGDLLLQHFNENLCYTENKKLLKLVKNIDWDLLSKQKLKLLENLENKEHSNSILHGIIHLLDDIQDFAVDSLKVPENKVFPNLQK